MLTGSIVAIVSPMHEDGKLDLDTLRALIDWHIREGTAGIVAVGTTGESPTVDIEEHCSLIETAVKHAAERVPIIAGTGANATSEAIELAHFAKKVGAHSHLSVVPYYNKPTQEGLYRHFRAIAEAVELPMIMYNVPGRTVADMANDTTLRLTQVPNIAGIKDATGNIERAADLVRRAPKQFALYSGDDGTGLAFMLMGGHGVISVTANVAPRLMQQMSVAALAGELAKAREINHRLLALHRDLFVEANPIPVKWLLSRMGKIKAGIRLPMTPLAQQHHEKLTRAMQEAEAGAAAGAGIR
jgi:4-hydroxy-tetrahydrodipicolinate synthase